MLEIAGLRLDPFRREVYRDGRYVALTRKQFAVLEVLVAAEGGVVSAEELLERAWDENADPFTNAVRITVSGLRKRLGDTSIETVVGRGYRLVVPLDDIDAHQFELTEAEEDKLLDGLDALGHQVENFPQHDLRAHLEWRPRNNEYVVKLSLILPGRTLVCSEHNADP